MRFLTKSVLILCSSIVISGCSLFPDSQNSSAEQVKSAVSQPAPTVATSALEYTITATQSGQTALEVSQSQLQLELKEYDFGVMVHAINGLPSDSTHFWALYQNGEQATTGAAQLQLQQNDTIIWKYEELQNEF